MACPLFLPGSPLPLSDFFGGSCSADPDAAIPTDHLIRCCNPGYARIACTRAAASDIDSIRMTIRADDGATTEIAWASERNHHPVAVGVIRVARHPEPPLTPLECQAHACAAAYLYRTEQI